MILQLLETQVNFLENGQLKQALNLESLFRRATLSFIKEANVSRQDFSDFYALDLLSPYLEGKQQLPNMSEGNKKRLTNLLLRRNKLVWDIANYYMEGMKKAITGEIRTFAWEWPYEEAKQAALRSAGLGSRSEVSGMRSFTPDQMISLFHNLDWSTAYGGPPWEYIATLYKELVAEVKYLKQFANLPTHDVIRWHMDGGFVQRLHALTTLIDRIHQAEHNTGSLFTHFESDISSWLPEALNEKAIPGSVQKLKQRVSPDVREMLSEVHPEEEAPDELEIGAQIAEVQMNRLSKKELQKAEQRFKNEVEKLEKYKDEWDPTTWQSELNYAKEKYEKAVKKWTPGSDETLRQLYTYGLSPKYILGYILKRKPEALDEYLYNNGVNPWTLDPDMFKHLIIKSRNAMLKQIGDNASYAIEEHNPETLDIIYNMFTHMPLKEFSKVPSLKRVMQVFKANGYPMTDSLKQVQTLIKDNPYYWSEDLAQHDKQLEMFSSRRKERIEKFAKLG